LQDQVIFCGWQESPARFIACSDLYVYPSRYEGSPNSLLEALGCMVPCLGSRIEEIAEILKYDELLFSLEDESMLAEKILKAVCDPVYYEHIKKLSMDCSESFLFDWGSETIKKIMSI
jgi:glycosyltransferase involved in cell wall biosynthesis